MNLLSEVRIVLFDLDGTLLPIEQEEFLQSYFKALSQEFNDLAAPDQFIANLWAATEQMIKNKEPRTNEEVFMEAFFSFFPAADEEDVVRRFDQFYKEKFPSLKNEFNFNQNSASAIINLFDQQSYSLVLATNPVFPREAIAARLNWINLTPTKFDLLTSYENMYYSKPNPKYYQEIVEKLEVAPTKCMMVGNDPQEDMIAKKLGMKTVLIDNFLIEREAEAKLEPDWQGSWQQFKKVVKKNL